MKDALDMARIAQKVNKDREKQDKKKHELLLESIASKYKKLLDYLENCVTEQSNKGIYELKIPIGATPFGNCTMEEIKLISEYLERLGYRQHTNMDNFYIEWLTVLQYDF
jgi:hypothetical protein